MIIILGKNDLREPQYESKIGRLQLSDLKVIKSDFERAELIIMMIEGKLQIIHSKIDYENIGSSILQISADILLCRDNENDYVEQNMKK